MTDDHQAPAIQTVQRAARILNAFTVARPRMSLSEITAHLGTSKTTAHRYTVALREERLLRYDESDGLYSLGPQILTLAVAARAALPIIRLAGPYMEELVRRVEKTAILSVWDGEGPVVVRTDESTTHDLLVSARVGSRLSALSSAQGRVFCAFLPPAEIPGIARELHTNPDLVRDLEIVRQTRLARYSSEVTGLRTVTTGVFQGDEIVAALGVVASAAASSTADAEREAQMILEIGARLSAELS